MAPVDLSGVDPNARSLVPNGEYAAVVRSAPRVETSRGSKTAGQIQVSVHLGLTNDDGEPVGSVWDTFYPFYDDEKGICKARWKQFLIAAGMPDDVLNGVVEWDTDDLFMAEFRVKVSTQKERPDGKGGVYSARNQIGQYKSASGGDELSGWAGV